MGISLLELEKAFKSSNISTNPLNARQEQAINTDGKVIIQAGAGAGKTTTIVHKLSKLLNTYDADEILTLTFTENAGKRLRKNIVIERRLFDKTFTSNQINYIGTFHSVFRKLLIGSDEYKHLRDFKILDEDEYKTYLEDFTADFSDDIQFKTKIGSIIRLNYFIEKNIEMVLHSDTIDDFFNEIINKITSDLFYTNSENIVKTFQDTKLKDKILSFSDIIIYTYFLLKNNGNYRNELKEQFKYILVDEFQDTNLIVLETLQLFSNENFMIVGDIYQSIYSFHGARYNKIKELYNEFEVIQLDTNYRSSENIVDFTNRFIESREIFNISNIENVKANGEKNNNDIEIIENSNEYTLAERISRLNGDSVILVRNNYQVRTVKKILHKYKIPFAKGYYKEFEMLLNSLLVMSFDNYEFKHEYFERFEIDKYEWNNDIVDFVRFVGNLINKNGIINYLVKRHTNEFVKRFKQWREDIFTVFRNSNDNELRLFIDALKDEINIWLDNEGYVRTKGIQVMTIHKAKGLEWDNVLLWDFQDGIFPRMIDNDEEMRLFYVAITRAIDTLIIFSQGKINSYVEGVEKCGTIKYLDGTIEYRKELNFDYEPIDKIEFAGHYKIGAEDLKFNKLIYDKNYVNSEYTKTISKQLSNINITYENLFVSDLNTYTIDDIDEMLYDLREFSETHEIDTIDVKNLIESIPTTIKKYVRNGKINYEFLNNEFTNKVHRIINFEDWADINEDFKKNDIKFIKKFKMIVKKFVSKKYTDITKDKATNITLNRNKTIERKIVSGFVNEKEDLISYMLKDYVIKSDKQKRFFTNYVLGMDNIKTGSKLIDFNDEMNDRLKMDIIADFDWNEEKGFFFNHEILSGAFINNRKKQLAFHRWGKLKYIEFMNKDKRAMFLTLTNPSEWHKWKTKGDNLDDMRKYMDEGYLIDNPKFIMHGDSFEEHIINSSININDIVNTFYHNLKTYIDDECKRKKIDNTFEVDFYKQLEPHKNLTAHAHIMLWIDEEMKHFVYRALKNTIEKHGLDRRFQKPIELKRAEEANYTDDEKIKHFEKLMELNSKLKIAEVENNKNEINKLEKQIKRFKNKHRDTVSSASTYVAKYAMKNAFSDTNSDDIEDVLFFNAWESLHGNKAKLTTSSNYRHSSSTRIQQMYNWFQRHAPNTLEIYKADKRPLHLIFEEHEQKKDFHFEYERRIKENFKEAEYKKDIQFIYTLLKIEELDIETINDYIEREKRFTHLQSDIANNFHLIINLSGFDDKYLWEIATRFVLANTHHGEYLNIHTDKKLTGFYVKKNLIPKSIIHLDEIEEYKETIKIYFGKITDTSIIENKNSIFHILQFDNKKPVFKWSIEPFEETFNFNGIEYENVYFEGMYQKGYIEENEIAKYQNRDIIMNLHNEIKNYPNYRENIKLDLMCSLKEPPNIIELMQKAS